MAKTESTLLNMVLSLLIITLVLGGMLGIVYKVTKKPIEQAKLAKQKTAIQNVVPGFNNNPTTEAYTLKSKEGYDLKVFPCKKDGKLLGVAISTITEKGFGGEVKIMVGMKPDGTILNYSVLEHQETPGLGAKMQDWFRDKPKTAGAAIAKPAQHCAFYQWFFGKEKAASNKNSVINKNPATTKMVVSKDGGDIDAITAATISSRAFLDAIMRAYDTYMKGGKK